MKVLVVEDEADLRRVLLDGLEEAGYMVDAVADGAEGLSRALHGQYDVVVLDVMLPKMGGLAVCHEMRRQDSQIPVLMLTALDRLDDKLCGFESGADDYLTKPFEFPELLARLGSLVRRANRVGTPTLVVADLELDLQANEARRGGQRLDLTRKEYTLLHYLAHNRGRILTRTQILDHVWPTDYGGCSNVVDVFIRYLRRKLEAIPGPKLIHTVVGVGYTLREPDSAE